MTNKPDNLTACAAQWVRIPNGTKVRHRHEGYDGHIDGLTEIVTGPNRNPDGKTQYRLNIGGSIRRLATQDDLSIFVDGDDLVIMIRQKEPYRRSITLQLHGILTADRFIKTGKSSAIQAVTPS